MGKEYIWVLFLWCGLSMQAQKAIAGYVNMNDAALWDSSVHLTEIDLKNGADYSNSKLVASSTVEKGGFFSFDKKFISEKNKIYRLHVDHMGTVVNDTVKNDRLFILSNKDILYFEKGIALFSKYTTTNTADVEWQRLREFEATFYDTIHGEQGKNIYVNKMKSYTKDSLRILLVKLISIKELENKKLLEKDIVTNPSYYVALLKELKESDLEKSEYQFLENKLTFITTAVVAEKYQESKIINTILVIAVCGLLFVVIRVRKDRGNRFEDELSKQEKNIQNLILQGKSNKEIANELFISLSTVKTHITSIYSKLQVSGRKELLQRK